MDLGYRERECRQELRDQMAMAALTMVAALAEAGRDWPWDFTDVYGGETTASDEFACAAYAIADAMLRARLRESPASLPTDAIP